MKLLTYTIPCYNSSAYMDHCISSLLATAVPGEVEIVIVDDGSTKDDTAGKADDWQRRHPGLIRVVHQENGGHGKAVMKAVEHATGVYFKNIDSDDWADGAALAALLDQLRSFVEAYDVDDIIFAQALSLATSDGGLSLVRGMCR